MGILVACVLSGMMALFGLVLYLAISTALIANTAQSLRNSAGGAIESQLNRPPRFGYGHGLTAPADAVLSRCEQYG